MTFLIILGIWFVVSLGIIYYVDKYYHWRHLSKVFLTASIVALAFNGWRVYDPALSNMIVTIETNPTWTEALLLSFTEGICITGPIAAVHLIKEKMKERRG